MKLPTFLTILGPIFVFDKKYSISTILIKNENGLKIVKMVANFMKTCKTDTFCNFFVILFLLRILLIFTSLINKFCYLTIFSNVYLKICIFFSKLHKNVKSSSISFSFFWVGLKKTYRTFSKNFKEKYWFFWILYEYC